MRTLALCLLVACGAPPPNECHSEYASASFELAENCAALDQRAELARRLLVDLELTGDSELDQLRAGAAVSVLDVECWNVPLGGRACSHYRPGLIELGPSLSALFHEELHMLEVSHWQWLGEHGQWKERGWHAIDEFYRFMLERGSDDTDAPARTCLPEAQTLKPEHEELLERHGWPVDEWRKSTRCLQ